MIPMPTSLLTVAGANPVSGPRSRWLLVDDTHAYILMDCEGGNPVSGPRSRWLLVDDTHAYILIDCGRG